MIYSNNGGGGKTKIITLLSNVAVDRSVWDEKTTEQYLPSHYRKGYINKWYKYINIGTLLSNYDYRKLNLNNFLVTINDYFSSENDKIRYNPSASFHDTLYRALNYNNDVRDVDVNFNIADSYDKSTGILKVLGYYCHYFDNREQLIQAGLDKYTLTVILNDVEYSSMAE